MELSPTELKIIDDSALLIGWNDGLRKHYLFSDLRKACPCAACRHLKDAEPASPMELPMLSADDIKPMKVEKMSLAGNYAYRITFSDGHNTGLFTFELLHELGEVIKEES